MPAQPPHRSRRARALATLTPLLVAAVLTAVPGPTAHAATGATAPRDAGFVDVRLPIADSRTLAGATALARVELGRSLGRMGVFQLDRRTGTVRVVARLDGFLTAPSTLPPRHVALGYVRAHLDALGLSRPDLKTFVFVRDYVDILGTHHLSWVQEANGVRAFDNGLEAAVTGDGRLLTLTGSPAHDLGVADAARTPGLSATQAIVAARAGVGASPAAGRGDTATLVLFHGGRSRLAWQTLTNVSAWERDLSVIDAATGDVLWRSNLVDAADQTGAGLAWDYFPGSKVAGDGGTQHAVTFPVAGSGKLSGNNAHVYLDTKDDNRAGAGDEVSSMSGLDWSYPLVYRNTTDANQNCSPAHPCTWDRTLAKSWRQNAEQNAVQVYYYLNAFHDYLKKAPIGFTEAAGNFQLNNTSGNGRGGDPVNGQVLDGASTNYGLPDPYHYNNANMYTPPDGKRPTMQMYLFRKDGRSPGWPSANAGDDASVVYHEYTHGLSSRLVTYPSGIQALNVGQSSAMGEAWSDWYAMDELVAQGWVPDNPAQPGDVVVGKWITGGEGIRFQALDCPVGAAASRCPKAYGAGPGGFTYADYARVAGGPEVHSDGEIWSQTLWDLRKALGRDVALSLVTRAMELSPSEPSFLDMRNAILQADVVAIAGAHADQIWKVFAHRGMGYYSSTVDGTDDTPAASYALPPSCKTDPCGKIRGVVTDAQSGRPVKGVVVALGGHDSGFPGTDLAAVTAADGSFAIGHVPFHTYADIVIDRWGLERVVLHGFTVNGDERLDRAVRRDWAALDGGATIQNFTPPDYSAYGCGPRQGFDRSLVSGWGSDAPRSTAGSSVSGPRSVVVRLPRAVDVTSFAIDPGATCGDGPKAGLQAFDVFTRTSGGPWVKAYGTTKALPQGVLTSFVPTRGTNDVVFVKLVMRANRGDPYYMDMTELSVRGR